MIAIFLLLVDNLSLLSLGSLLTVHLGLAATLLIWRKQNSLYIERFRHGLPQSRTQRQLVTSVSGEEQELLWWMFHSSSPCTTPTKTLHRGTFNLLPLYLIILTLFSDTSQGDLEDSDVLQLQDRAGRLILENEDDLNTGSVHVSSDGLGFSGFSSPASVDEPVRQPFIHNLMNPGEAKISTRTDSIHAFQKSVLPTLTPPTRPEEDILFQWRLRRKLEQARESSSLHGSTFSWQAPRLSHPPASGLEQQTTTSQPAESSHKDDHLQAHKQIPPALPAYVVSSSSASQSVSRVPPHMHLLCDVLPCPVPSSHLKETQSISQELQESHNKVAHKTIQVPESSALCLGENLTSSPHTVEGEELSRPKIPEKNKNAKTKEPEKTGATKHKRKSARERGQKMVTPPKDQLQREKSHESCPTVYEPPPSPVHIAMGRVVSEVLFPVSPDPMVTTAKNSSVSPCEAQNSLKVISELLQKAEDSDETEFENDPLLQVLRQQRKWVKNQIRY
ncbi:Proline and serine-rich protein 3 [Oryzias melastigma]|uniref:Proline and serine-rich protein 3 n=1 Tax=Oryzias melastigma TaxID=30732 RepID=A0A834FT41_ORYME|nr:Proline and serine-rich protein 3 [Oryzias melastigma]